MFDVYDKLPVSHDLNDGKARSRDVLIDHQVKFSSLLLEPQIHDGLTKCGYVHLSPIQQNALPLALTGSSVIAHSKSGTGKTLIFALTALNDFVKRKPDHLQYLILAPTREIAKQIYDVFQNVACFLKGIQIEFFIGGTPIDIDVIKCKSCHVAIGAPGRIKHLIDLGFLKTHNLQLLVLDEVDALFDHEEYAIADIISLLPSSKQLIVCSATFSCKIGELVKSIVPDIKYTSYEKLESEEMGYTSNMLLAVQQYVATVKKDSSSVDAMSKRNKLIEIISNFSFEQCFIFVNYISSVKSICNLLTSQNFAALWISSEQNQSTRINTLNKLKMNHCKILVTTDLAARGIDVHKVNLVINLGLPCPADVYIHRMGRAGRYGSEGAVITILSEGEEMATFLKMISIISTDPVDLHLLPENIDSNLSNLEIIQCLPTEGSISDNEFFLNRNIKDNRNTDVIKMQKHNKKAKVKKTKNKNNVAMSVLQNGVDHKKPVQKNEVDHVATSQLMQNVKNVVKIALQNGVDQFPPIKEVTASHKIVNQKEDKAIAPKTVNQRVELFWNSLVDRLASGEPEVEWDSMKRVFNSNNDDTFTDGSLTFMLNPPQSLLAYAEYVKQRNEYLDEQIMPCNIDEFLNVLNRNDDTFGRHSSGLCNLVKEISTKISEPVRQKQRINRHVSLAECDSVAPQPSKNSRKVFSRILSEPLRKSTKYNNEDEKNSSRITVDENSVDQSRKRISRFFGLANEFSNAMKDVSSETYHLNKVNGECANPSDRLLDTTNNMIDERPSQTARNSSEKTAAGHSLSDQFMNSFTDGVIEMHPRNTFETTSPNRYSTSFSSFDLALVGEKQLPLPGGLDQKGMCSKQISNELSYAVNDSAAEIHSRSTSKQRFSNNSSQSVSVLNGEKQFRSEAARERAPPSKRVSNNLGLSEQFSNAVNNSGDHRPNIFDRDQQSRRVQRTDSISTSRDNIGGRKDFDNFGCKYGSKPSSQRMWSKYSRLDDRRSRSVSRDRITRKSFEHVPSRRRLSDESGHRKHCQNVSVLKNGRRNVSKSTTNGSGLSDQFFDCFTDSHQQKKIDKRESIELSKFTRSRLSLSNQLFDPANHSSEKKLTPPNIRENSSSIPPRDTEVKKKSSFISESDSEVYEKSSSSSNANAKIRKKSNLISVVNLEMKKESSSRPMRDPEMENKPSHIPALDLKLEEKSPSIITPNARMKNSVAVASLDSESDKKPGSILVSNPVLKISDNIESSSGFRTKSAASTTNHFESAVESPKNIRKSFANEKQPNKSECNLRISALEMGSFDENAANTGNFSPSFVPSAENLKQINGTVPPPSTANFSLLQSKIADNSSEIRHRVIDQVQLPPRDRISPILPSLLPYVSAHQEQNIWGHHFAFINRSVFARRHAPTNQWR